MSDRFAKGTAIPLANGDKAVVGDFLGEGGQGAVYRVKVGGRDYALKWYKKSALKDPDRFYKNLEYNIGKGAPTAAFLWPLYLTQRTGDSFGYVMNLRAGNYKDFGEFLLANVRFGSLLAALNACLNITNGFRQLHRAGFSYQDLNDGNFFIDPSNGDVMICDNDNVAPSGESLGIAGKARYMAPEVVRNLERPNKHTDCFSLAVILFRILFLDHPLEGKRLLQAPCLTEELDLKFYGQEPIFIYDPDDDSNRPDRSAHPNAIRFWQKYPKAIQDKFIEAFTKDAMLGKTKRVNGSDWQLAFTQLRDMLIPCPCGGETFFDPSQEQAACIHCKKNIPRPSVLSVKKYRVVLFPGKKLYRCHTGKDNDDYREVCGEVVRSPSNPQIWGLKNLSQKCWTATELDGAVKQIEQDKVLVIPRTKAIGFGDCEATVAT